MNINFQYFSSEKPSLISKIKSSNRAWQEKQAKAIQQIRRLRNIRDGMFSQIRTMALNDKLTRQKQIKKQIEESQKAELLLLRYQQHTQRNQKNKRRKDRHSRRMQQLSARNQHQRQLIYDERKKQQSKNSNIIKQIALSEHHAKRERRNKIKQSSDRGRKRIDRYWKRNSLDREKSYNRSMNDQLERQFSLQHQVQQLQKQQRLLEQQLHSLGFEY